MGWLNWITKVPGISEAIESRVKELVEEKYEETFGPTNKEFRAWRKERFAQVSLEKSLKIVLIHNQASHKALDVLFEQENIARNQITEIPVQDLISTKEKDLLRYGEHDVWVIDSEDHREIEQVLKKIKGFNPKPAFIVTPGQYRMDYYGRDAGFANLESKIAENLFTYLLKTA